MRGTPPALQVAAENFRRDVALSESGELSKVRHRPSNEWPAYLTKFVGSSRKGYALCFLILIP